MQASPIIQLNDVSITYNMGETKITACDKINLKVNQRDSLGIVGESGSGKSTLAMGILGLLPRTADIQGEILFKDRNLVGASEKEYGAIRWKYMSAVFQKSLNSLSPVHRVGKQIASIYRVHNPSATKNECREVGLRLLDKVNLPARVYDSYPHELSGGMMQRVSIAISLMFNPDLIILDEATTALDVVTEGQILEEIVNLQKTEKITRMMITHNVSVVASTCKKVAVMYAGRLLETGLVNDVFINPKHPYTQGLLRSFPSFKGEKESIRAIPGSLPDLSKPIEGCVFAPRCPHAVDKCYSHRPNDFEVGDSWMVACSRVEDGDKI